MAVLVRDRIQELTQQLTQFIPFSSESGLTCGVILAPCAKMNQKRFDDLKSFISQNEPEISAQYFFDDRHFLLSIVLDDQKLVGTHYTSLVVKDFLQSHSLLEGQIVVASFPESGESTEQTMSQLVQAVTETKGENKDIRLFVDHTIEQGISSILIVDTDEVVREFVKLRLELKGYRVYEAKDGSEALDKFSQLSPDLVITELNLPIVDGYQLIHKIQQGRTSEKRVIVLTDKYLSDHMHRAFELGASDYITKPFSISELEWRIKKLGVAI